MALKPEALTVRDDGREVSTPTVHWNPEGPADLPRDVEAVRRRGEALCRLNEDPEFRRQVMDLVSDYQRQAALYRRLNRENAA